MNLFFVIDGLVLNFFMNKNISQKNHYTLCITYFNFGFYGDVNLWSN